MQHNRGLRLLAGVSMRGQLASMAPSSALSQRNLQPEVMDQPELDPELHARALEALARINALSCSANILFAPIRELARRLRSRPITILDLASGGGDVTIGLWQRLHRSGVEAEILGRDKSPTAVAIARKRAARLDVPVTFETADALQCADGEQFDVVMSSLFMHHLSRDRAVWLLERMKHSARHLVLVNDLLRSRRHYLLAVAVSQLVSRSAVVHIDALRSVEGAFSRAEVHQVAADAGLVGATIKRCWPCRFLMSWSNAAPGSCG